MTEPLRIADYEDYLAELSDSSLLEELERSGGVCHAGWEEIRAELSRRGLLTFSDEETIDVNDAEIQQEQDDHDRNCQHYETERYQSASGDYTIINGR